MNPTTNPSAPRATQGKQALNKSMTPLRPALGRGDQNLRTRSLPTARSVKKICAQVLDKGGSF